ncbi:hypothetical protein DPSP01_010185 [Paraphaeosphaeria sporulosa]|uniref:Histone-lysine N-methyltransferase SET5 n=1 Tax=Paraphaeosphaeria sporulosa TaxID=1460663 RepID=A0A177CZZ4_9PLEO|nr:uncharacterized protein CC84DRAFT_1212182 [Paraphaeosphaeria sporulosa]OAG12668.1 hypothetical protein CC84DRAFT_1212182 [Paraphaeosphaeria sporulosa]
MSDENTHTAAVLTVFNTNAMGAYLGLQTVLLNHSCAPDAYAGFEEGRGEIRVHALRDIQIAEEICISHLEGSALFESINLHRGILVLQRGFLCLCDACMDVEERELTGREAREEKLRANLRGLTAKYRRNKATLIEYFGIKGHMGVDPGFATFLAKVGAATMEVLEKLGFATIETLEWPMVEDEEMRWSTFEESSEEEDNSKDDDYVD